MTTYDKTKIQHLNELVNVKETEWRSLLQQQLDSLLKELGERDEELKLEKLRFSRLKTDFEYNLNLLSERDHELDEYDKVFQQLKANDTLKNSELSEMKIKVDEAEKRYDYSQKEKGELQKHYQLRLKGYQDEVNSFYFKKDHEVEQERSNFESTKKELQRKVREIEEDSAFTRQKLVQEFDEKLKEKEKEFQETLEKKDTELHLFQLKIKMISKELELLRSSTQKVEDSIEDNKVKAVQLERQLKQKDWELEDSMNMKNLKIKELQENIKALTKKHKSTEEEFSIKCGEMEKLINERQQQMVSLKDAADTTEESMRNELTNMKQKNEELAANIRRMGWDTNDQLKEKDFVIRSLQDRVADLVSSLNDEIETSNKEKVSKDVELETLKASQSQLHYEKKELRDEVDRLKKNLNTAVQHGNILEDAKVQLEMDWRRRLETREGEIYNRHEQLIRNLTTAKDEALATVKEKEDELTQQEHVLKMLQSDKNIAAEMLRNHGIEINGIFQDEMPAKENAGGIEDFREQNEQLKDIIKQMRIELEMLNQQSANALPGSDGNPPEKKSNYTDELEIEVRHLKATNRDLRNKIEDLTKEKKPPTGKQQNESFDANSVKDHLKELNDTIGFLRNEKVQLSAFLTSKDAKIRHLHKCLSECQQQKQEQQLVLDNINYDIKTKGQVDYQTVATLKERVSQLQSQLEQAQSEADVYYKSVMERNMDATRFSTQLSELKLKKSQTALHHNSHTMNSIKKDAANSEDGTKVNMLKSKLKLAVERIKELTKEREKLISVGNRLRAELSSKPGVGNENISNPDSSKKSNIHQLQNKMKSKLDTLEQFHYQNTEKELRDADVSPVKEQQQIIVEINPESSLVSEERESSALTDLRRSIVTPIQMTSSDHSSTIKEVWKLLEQDDISIGSSTKHFQRVSQHDYELEVTRDNADHNEHFNEYHQHELEGRNKTGNNIEIVGQHYSENVREKPNKLLAAKKPITKVQPKKQKAKIRNYNKR